LLLSSPHISHALACESKRRQEPIFPQALASRHFWVMVAGLNRLRRAPKMAGTIFSFIPTLISSTALRGLWCGLRLQVLLED
jgi:hypothetical protein